MNCMSCVVIAIVAIDIVVISGYSSWPQVWSQKLHILHIYAHVPLVFGREILANMTYIFKMA